MTTRRLLILAAALLLGVLFFLDLNTGRELIPAIAYTVPVALSSLAHAPRWTGALVVLSLLATAGAGVQNTLAEGLSSTALLNRVLAAISVALVGTFVLLLERKGACLTQLEREEGRADREADLRQLLTDLSHEHTPHTLLSHAATSLQPLFGAAKVVISATSSGRLAAPHYSSAPDSGGELCEGRLTPWVAALPATDTQVASARLDGKLLTAGWLRRPGKAPLLVLVACPRAEEPCMLLSDVLAGLEPLLEHAEGLEDRAWSPQAVLN